MTRDYDGDDNNSCSCWWWWWRQRCLKLLTRESIATRYVYSETLILHSLNLHVLTFAFSAIVRSNFEVSLAETLSILHTFPFLKLSTNKCYDWFSEISPNKTFAASIVRTNSANKTSVGSKQAKPSYPIFV